MQSGDTVIYDLDGTVADCSHRRHLVQAKPKNYDAFEALCGLDKPIWPVINTILGLRAAGFRILPVSGRRYKYHKETYKWLEEVGLAGLGDWVFMRDTNDSRPDCIIKEEILDQKILPLGFKPFIIFDDRQSVVDMWRRRGYVCAQVAPGDF